MQYVTVITYLCAQDDEMNFCMGICNNPFFSPFLHFLRKDQKRVGVNTNFIFIVLVYSIYIYIGCNVLAHLTRKPMRKHLFLSTAKFPLLIKAAYLLMGEIRVPKKKTFNKYMPLLVT